ncbi:MAG: selenide, water dikinase SelD [Hyphomicrobiaceae bacterium]|nr:selenide, water dikinase SelD [Hyphomicrobiaceae bacterium]
MTPGRPPRKHLVLVGGGHAHVTVLRSLGMKPEPEAIVTLVSRELEAPYSGMLPGLVAGHYSHEECHIDLVRLAAWAGVRVVHGTVTGIDREARQLRIEGRPPLGYDVVSIDVGITPHLDAIAGAAEYGLAVKPVSLFAAKWARLEAAAARPDGPRHIVVGGAGAAGFELVLAARHRLLALAAGRGIPAQAFTFTLVGGSVLLPSHNARARDLARAELDRQGVRLIEHQAVKAIAATTVVLGDGRSICADAVLLATRARPATWFAASGLPVDEEGFIAVRPTLAVTDDEDVFAVGDCSTVLAHRREKSGVFAVRQGPPLTDNLRRRLNGLPLRPFVPQTRFLTLLSTGGKHAIAARNGLAVAGDWVWRWKDGIDRAFMDRFNVLPPMRADAHGDQAEMRCAGCAAKVGPATLAASLERLGGAAGPRDDAATFDDGAEHLRVETIDFFRAFWPEPFVFGAIAANHAMSDVYAMGGRPTHALANIVLPYAAPRLVGEDLFQVLAGARESFERDGVALAGGHTSEGAEFAAGFFVSGRVRREAVWRKAGLRAGDALILTKPVGTGILFAALMRGLARGRYITAVLAAMSRSNRAAAEALCGFAVTAATDVTGFGLAGHLMEMLEASHVAAEIDLEQVPVYAGALELARSGIASSLVPENLTRAGAVTGAGIADAGVLALLFDPQTSGGLLAAVPEGEAGAALAAVRAAGEEGAAIIGRVRAGAPAIVLAGALPPS